MAHGYIGGQDEASLVKAAQAILVDDEMDVVTKIKTKYWVLGQIIEIAKERKYIEAAGGLKGWLKTVLKTSHTHGYRCLKAWENRRSFDAAYAWYQSAKNSGFTPTRMTGPTFANEIVGAYLKRNKPTLIRPKAKSKKALEQQVARWKARYEMIRPVLADVAEQDDRAARLLNMIDREIKADEDDTFTAIASDEPEHDEVTESEPDESKAALPSDTKMIKAWVEEAHGSRESVMIPAWVEASPGTAQGQPQVVKRRSTSPPSDVPEYQAPTALEVVPPTDPDPEPPSPMPPTKRGRGRPQKRDTSATGNHNKSKQSVSACPTGLLHADCMSVMRAMPDNAVTLTLTDIPYGECDRPNGLRDSNKTQANTLTMDLEELVQQIIRVTSGSIYMFCGQLQISTIIRGLRRAGLTTRLCIWHKTNPLPMNGEHFWLSDTEHCVFGRKSNATFTQHCEGTVWKCPVVPQPRIHPTTQKPLDLFRYLVESSSRVGDLVFDPFLGSGTTAVACEETGRRFFGCEIYLAYYRAAVARLGRISLDKAA